METIWGSISLTSPIDIERFAELFDMEIEKIKAMSQK
jgi:hypothetical protein